MSELANVPEIDHFVGPVPEEVQYLSIFLGRDQVSPVIPEASGCRNERLIHFLGSEPAEAAIRRGGMDPVKSR